MKETFGLWSLLTVGSSMWISITVSTWNDNNETSRCKCANYGTAWRGLPCAL